MASIVTLAHVLVILAAWTVHAHAADLPQLDPNEWWGDESLKCRTNTSITPFTVKFSEEMIQDLRYRLKNHRRAVPPLQGVGFEYGFNQNEIETWVNYWADEYDFAAREKFFNKFPQYITNIQGLDIHFIWIKPKKLPKRVVTVPLLLLHGWPSSVRDIYDAIPILTTYQKKYNFVFEIVALSTPGFGFSDSSVRPGLGLAEIGMISKNLMNRLGHKKFYVQGADWGSLVGSAMATLWPEEVLGFHSILLIVMNNICTEIQTLVGSISAAQMIDRNETGRDSNTNMIEELGYMHHQATKPDTLGIALTDSPIGLLTYILQKFSVVTRTSNRYLADGGLYNTFTQEQLIDAVMMYWVPNKITTSMRLYANIFSNRSRAQRLDTYPCKTPVWNCIAKYDMFNQPPNVLKFPHILGTTVLDGGHFLAYEVPDGFARDIFKAVKAFREYHAKKNKQEL